MSSDVRRRTLTAPEDLPGPAIIPISGLSKESQAYLDAKVEKSVGDETGGAQDEET